MSKFRVTGDGLKRRFSTFRHGLGRINASTLMSIGCKARRHTFIKSLLSGVINFEDRMWGLQDVSIMMNEHRLLFVEMQNSAAAVEPEIHTPCDIYPVSIGRPDSSGHKSGIAGV